MSECGTCLVYHINEGLSVISAKGTDRATHVFAREDLLDQGGEFIQNERAADQTPTGWSIESGKE